MCDVNGDVTQRDDTIARRPSPTHGQATALTHHKILFRGVLRVEMVVRWKLVEVGSGQVWSNPNFTQILVEGLSHKKLEKP